MTEKNKKDTAPEKPKKVVMLKQHLVLGMEKGAETASVMTFILSTCGATARQEFAARFPDLDILQVTVTADSELTKDDALSRDLWAEGRNWTTVPSKPELSESGRRYFELKKAADENRAKPGFRSMI